MIYSEHQNGIFTRDLVLEVLSPYNMHKGMAPPQFSPRLNQSVVEIQTRNFGLILFLQLYAAVFLKLKK